MKARTLTLISALALTLLIPLSGAAQAVRDHPDATATTLPPPWHSAVVVDFVYYDPPGFDWPTRWQLNREYVVVRNYGWRGVNLDGWTLENSDNDEYEFDDVWLPGRSTVTVHTGPGRDRWRHVYWDRRDFVWDNFRDTATLSDDDGRTVDTCSWWRNWPGFTTC